MKLSQNGQGKSFEETFYNMKNADLKTFYSIYNSNDESFL